MYVYIDETGNTGKNLFDENQPVFTTGSLMTLCNFDEKYNNQISAIASRVGSAGLHANELGIQKIETVAGELLRILEKSEAQFFISQADKQFFAIAKIVDTFFDSYENHAVPWHVYNWKPLRMLLVFKFGILTTQDDAKSLWHSLTNLHKDESIIEIQVVLRSLLKRVHVLPDNRSRELISQSLEWAIDNAAVFGTDVVSKKFSLLNFPNVAAFMPLLQGIEAQSHKWNKAVDAIVHDRQVQFQTILTKVHEAYSSTTPFTIELPFNEQPFTLPLVAGSRFFVLSSTESVGIQVIDVVLWLLRKAKNQEKLPPRCRKLMQYIVENGTINELSFQAASDYLNSFNFHLGTQDLTDEQLQQARIILDKVAKKRT